MIGAFFAAKLLGIPRWLWIIAFLALLYAALVIAEGADDKNNQTIGATVEREAQTREVLERTETGNAAREEVREAIARDGGRSDIVYDQCVRTARTPANCERFLPERPADQR